MTLTISLSRSTELKGSAHSRFRTASGPFERLPAVVTSQVWSPIVWKNGLRKKSEFVSSSLVALDFDTGEWTLQDAKDYAERLGLCAILATTKSHQKEKKSSSGTTEPPCDRFRLILKASCTNSVDDFEYTMKTLTLDLPADKSCKDAARFYYPCRDVVWTSASGAEVHWLACPYEETEEGRRELEQQIAKEDYRNPLRIPPYIKQVMRLGIKPPGRHKELYKIGCRLGMRGWREGEIMQMLKQLNSPLLEVGEDDARRAVNNGIERATR